jgi:predicted ArsR family transcriptional regulator
MSFKRRVLKLLQANGPMISLDMADVLRISAAAASTAAKELHTEGLVHIKEWRANSKNGSSKVYMYSAGVDAAKPEAKWQARSRFVAEADKSFVPHADVAASWIPRKVELAANTGRSEE